MEESTPVELLHSRIRLLVVVLLTMGTMLLGRYWHLQIWEGPAFADKADRLRVKRIRLPAPRGYILDRNGVPLADNRPSYSLWLDREVPFKEREPLLRRLATTLHRDPDEMVRRFNDKRRRVHRDFHIRVLDDLSEQEFAIFETKKYAFSGIKMTLDERRFYPEDGTFLCHVLGKVGEVSARELESEPYTSRQVQPGDYIGKTGLERRYDDLLIGTDGYAHVEVDSVGRQSDVLDYWPSLAPERGGTLELTVDAELQRIVEEEFIAEKGAVIAMDPDTFEIRAYLSRPGFDPNLFAGRLDRETYQGLLRHPHKPFIDRGVQGQYPPGSVFKLVTLVAGLLSGTVDEQTTTFCPGHFVFARRPYHCWKEGGHGSLTARQSIKHSCNVYFFKSSSTMQIDPITAAGEKFGFGSPTGIELDNEKSGIMPGKDWKRRARKEPWWPGETLSVSIGQGFLLTTPMQIVQFLGVLATRGEVYRPTLVSATINSKDVRREYHKEDRFLRKIELEDRKWDVLLDGMRLVVEEGTARRAAVEGLKIYGKTGTAQVAGSKVVELKADEEPPPHLRDHNWFASICVAERERLCMVVFIENGGKEGGKQRLEFTRNIYRRYFQSNPETPESAGLKAPAQQEG